MGSTSRTLCLIAGIYGAGFGLWSIPTALFVGPHLLLASLSHIALGGLFLLAAFAIQTGRRWGNYTAIACSLVAAGVGVLGLIDSAQASELHGVFFFAILTSYFLVAAISSFIAAIKKARPDLGY